MRRNEMRMERMRMSMRTGRERGRTRGRDREELAALCWQPLAVLVAARTADGDPSGAGLSSNSQGSCGRSWRTSPRHRFGWEGGVGLSQNNRTTCCRGTLSLMHKDPGMRMWPALYATLGTPRVVRARIRGAVKGYLARALARSLGPLPGVCGWPLP